MPKGNHFLKCRTKPAPCGDAGSEVTPAEGCEAQPRVSPESQRGEGVRGEHGALWKENKNCGRPLKYSCSQLAALGPREEPAGSGLGEGQDGSGQCWTQRGPGHGGLCHCPSSGQAGRDQETQIPA